jgi:signal transduction histidine kinase/streptogramin lyase
VDREDNLWIGTDAGGLNRLRKSSLIAYTAKRGFTDKATMAIYADHQGDLWIGALGGAGLFRFRNGSFQVFPGPSGERIDSIGSLAEDSQENLWIGDWYRGLSSLRNGSFIHHAIPGMSAADAVRSLHVDREGVLWIGTDRFGLYRFQNGEFKNYGTSAGLASAHVGFITQDTSGTLWLGTAIGISRFRADKFTNYRAPGVSLVRTIHEDADGTLWIGTYGFGLSRFKNGKFDHITSKDGLFDDVVSCIVEDDRSNLWISGNRGIFRVARNELNGFADGVRKSVNSVSYGVADGMEVSETNGGGEPTCWKARDGKLWFAMIKGVVVIDPDRTNLLPPPMVIEQVILNRQPLSPGHAVRIEPGTENLEIHYAGLSFTRPEQVKFKYQLAGLDHDWVNAGTRRTAYFPHLPPGDYTFKVIAENGDGVWNREGASLAITVVPAFWRSGWFLLCLLAAIAGACTLAYRFRVAHLIRVAEKAASAREAFSRQLLDSQERERRRIAAELHDGLGQNLLIIKNRALLALGAMTDNGPAREQLDEISSSASQAVEEVREICHNLRPYQLDRFGLTKTLNGICQRATRTSGIEFRAHLEPLDGMFSSEVETSIYRIVQEGINNIIKHSQATEAELAIRRVGGELRVELRDDGKGFTPSAVNPEASRPGGFGLIGIAERARMLGGSLTIESAPGRGTATTLRLPIPWAGHEG